MENPIKMDDLGVPLFSETSIYFLRIRLYVLRFRDYSDPFLFISDGIGTRKIPERSGFLGSIINIYLYIYVYIIYI